GFVADRDGAAIAPLEADVVLDALGRLNPFRLAPTPRQKVVVVGAGGAEGLWGGTASLDGFSFTVRGGTRAAEGHFRVTSVGAGAVEEFERVLFRFARQVVETSGEGRFGEQLGRWACSREPVRSAAPGAAADRSCG